MMLNALTPFDKLNHGTLHSDQMYTKFEFHSHVLDIVSTLAISAVMDTLRAGYDFASQYRPSNGT
jgi:hypothetical protein